ncbi:MAG TPA: hypothetical protein VHA80_06100, partial [Solirubrobacterales bacterium]|nr:hypothetical protein [Solirubrobacterales bacterium]
SRVERRQLLECLQAYEAYILDEAEPTFAEFRRFHESEIEDLDRFREAQLEELRGLMQGEVEAERMRAEAAEAELASWQAATPRRLAREATRRLRRRIDPRARR